MSLLSYRVKINMLGESGNYNEKRDKKIKKFILITNEVVKSGGVVIPQKDFSFDYFYRDYFDIKVTPDSAKKIGALPEVKEIYGN